MSELLEILDEGRERWLSWIVAREPYANRSARHRLDILRQRFTPAVADLAKEFEPRNWLEAEPEPALRLAADRAKHGIAYNRLELPSKRVAHAQFDRFMDRFSGQSRLFLNTRKIGIENLPLDPGASREEINRYENSLLITFDTSQPLTQSTFDLAVGVVDGDTIGIFCIEDED